MIIAALVIANILINKFNARKKEQAAIEEEKREE